MSLRRKTSLIIGITIVVITGVLYVSLRWVLLDSFARLEHQEMLGHTRRAVTALACEMDALRTIAGNWARRDDTYDSMGGLSGPDIAEHLGARTLANLNLDLILFARPDGQVAYSRSFDPASGEAVPAPPGLLARLDADSPLLRHASPEGTFAGLIPLAEGPLLVGAQPILTGESAGPARGTLIVGRYLDRAEMARLGERTDLPFALHPQDDPALPSGLLDSLQEEAVLVRPLDDRTVAGYALLPGIEGRPAYVLALEQPRTIYAQGLMAVRFLLVALLTVDVAFGLLALVVLLEWGVLSPMARLSAQVARVGASSDPSARVPVGGAAELARLARSINSMLDALQRSRSERQQAQEEVLESTQLLRSVVEGIPIGICAVDRDLHVTLWNAALERMSGLRRDQVMGKAVLDQFPEFDLSHIGPALQRVVEAGEPVALYECAFGAQSPLRKTRYCNLWANPLYDSEGRVSGGVFAVEDITGRKRIEMVQATSYRIARAAGEYDSLEGLLQYVHHELAALMDASNFYIAFPELEHGLLRFAYIVDDYAGELGRADRSRELRRGLTEYLMETGRALLASRAEIEALVAEGKVELIGHLPAVWLGAPLRSEEKTIGAIAMQDYDDPDAYTQEDLELLQFVSNQIAAVIERKRAEENLARERNLLQALTDAVVDGIAVIDGNGTITYLNQAYAAVHGYESPQQLLGRSWRLLYSAAEQQRLEQEAMPVLGAQGRWRGEATGRRHDGTTFPQEVSLSTLSGGGRVCVVHDITEHKRLRSQLLQAQKMEAIGQLAGGVAHDFNNLLTAISGYASFAHKALPPGSTVRDDVSQILAASERAANLTRQLLAFSRRQIIAPRVTDLNEVIAGMGKMLRRLINENIELVTVPASRLGLVKVDPGQTEQVLLNLVVNASDAMPEGGRLTIETANVELDEEYARRHVSVVPGDYVVIAVSDTGCGMSEEIQARIFEPFFSTKEPGKGTGLGLATCYGIVRQSGGHIWLYSEPGKGTTFKIYFPRVDTAKQSAEDVEDASPSRARPTQTILLVEDEASVRSFAARVLREAGYTTLEAANGAEALALANDHSDPIDLLVTDVVMPQMGGKELGERIREKHPRIKVLYVSGYTANSVVHQGVVEDGIVFLHKPFTLSSLTRKVREVLEAAPRG